MVSKLGKELLQEKLPITKNPTNFLILGILQFVLFIILLFILLKITNYNWKLSIIGECVISFFAILPYSYVTINSNRIRRKYREKYNNLAFQKVWLRFLSYNEPLSAAGLLFPLLLKTDYFLPSLIQLPSNTLTKTLLPFYIAIPLGISLITLGILIRKPTGGYDSDIGSYMYLIFPEESRRLKDGYYSYIRHPNYCGRGLIVFGIVIFTNSLLVIVLGFIHFFWFYILSKIEDKELVKRFGEEFKRYEKSVPAMIPRPKNWLPFFKIAFFGEEK